MCANTSACGGSTDLLSTGGGDVVHVYGTGFPPVNSTGSDARMTMTMFNAASTLVLSQCVVTTAFVEITCNVTPGVGTGFRWQLVVEGLTSPPSPFNTSYAPPTINATVPGQVPTTGGVVTIVGSNLGYLGLPASLVSVSINDTSTGNVQVIPFVSVQSDTLLSITTTAGQGTSFLLQVSVSGRPSNSLQFKWVLPSLRGRWAVSPFFSWVPSCGMCDPLSPPTQRVCSAHCPRACCRR